MTLTWKDEDRSDGVRAVYRKDFGCWVVEGPDHRVLHASCPCCQKPFFSRESARKAADSLIAELPSH